MTSPTTDPIRHLIHLDLKPLIRKLESLSISEEKIEAIIRFLRADYITQYLIHDFANSCDRPSKKVNNLLGVINNHVNCQPSINHAGDFERYYRLEGWAPKMIRRDRV